MDGELATFDAWEHSIRVNNVLSLGHVTDIVKHPDVPDRDLFVFDTKTDKLVETVDTLGIRRTVQPPIASIRCD